VIRPADFYEALRANGFTFFTGVPDSLLKDLCAYITDHAGPRDHVINANEGAAVALAAGYHLATGRPPVVYLQNSGVGNAVNPLLSLADPAVYRIPILFVIGWRGEPGVADEPQHVTQGAVMEELLTAIGLEWDVVDAEKTDMAHLVSDVRGRMEATGRSHVLLVRKGAFAPYEARVNGTKAAQGATRSDAIRIVLAELGSQDVVVSTTGMTSREVFAYREEHGQGHGGDFLTVGSMGHCSQIALGVAEHRPSCAVYCLDGDGAVLMHMGSLAIIGGRAPANFRHVVVNNGAHDSVGGQPTVGLEIDLCAVARGCGYASAESVAEIEQLGDAMRRLRGSDGPALLEVKVQSRARTDAGRPTTTPIENKTAFMAALADNRG
jgi:phosphonopyruvate decarboxylase